MFEIIYNDIKTALIQYVPYAVAVSVIAITAVFVLLLIITEEEATKVWKAYHYKFTLLFFIFIYLLGMVAVTFLSRESGSRNGMDLRLFSTFSRSYMSNKYLIENIILFIPLGLLLPPLWKRFHQIVICSLSGFLISLAIEVSQLLTKRGYFQIDDILTNTIGCIIGFGIYSLLRLIHNYYFRLFKK